MEAQGQVIKDATPQAATWGSLRENDIFMIVCGAKMDFMVLKQQHILSLSGDDIFKNGVFLEMQHCYWSDGFKSRFYTWSFGLLETCSMAVSIRGHQQRSKGALDLMVFDDPFVLLSVIMASIYVTGMQNKD